MVEKALGDLWIQLPCIDRMGSCTYDDVCSMLDEVIPPGTPCPEPLLTDGIPCHCPFKAVRPSPCGDGGSATGYHCALRCRTGLLADLLSTCPLSPQGSYSLPASDFDVPDVELPSWMTNGNYRVRVVVSNGGEELSCVKLAFSLHSH